VAQIDETVYMAQGAVVVGDVRIGARSSVWHNAVLRGDVAPIVVGAESNVQDCAVLHGATDFGVVVGNGVTIGHGAIVHGCTIGDNALIGMGAIVLNGAQIGRDCIVGAGAVVTQGTVIPDGSVAFGSPARVVRPVTDEDRAANRANAQEYVQLASN
jgi:carbonic anhydrase/acetyltransferase-like protein (isoleucine patch superfamily)